jgi:hypothetical protein
MSLTNIPLSILLIWVSVFQCFAADYYLFPIKEIEGLSTRGDANYRPLVDRKVLEYLPADNQKKILEQFEKSLYDAYPNATVSQKQVGNVVKGKYLYLPQANCGSEFTAPIKSSYAVTLGVTRASEYIVEKGNVGFVIKDFNKNQYEKVINQLLNQLPFEKEKITTTTSNKL